MIGSDTLVTPELFTVLLDMRMTVRDAAVNGALLHQNSRGRLKLEVGAIVRCTALDIVPMKTAIAQGKLKLTRDLSIAAREQAPRRD
ncbi:hypothetical protein HBH56_010480 [Parastagonospora nodorum]|uniref:Uncharacterized protein n=1 Tax=Phaeosphaeria nodorum (strain SN15 / ATCC MYA-4574 / FGSC 10173) TaxID=321614 RepID=Q0V6W5_PHANO|nr:hypothetical protein SNOG_00249 [Parastagonospora nodorum SN15]KAH3920825.1 hypothetical protein HBH56_010480 [Parastagonospora nodorum]EAT91744.1 hypothetical protein SNOG_00249 [Parastagonospora nodorum SN15]KAH3934838.1 hypothetical protein HBH54_043780 [Parastagonospora nodorum]KAH3987388.1 hypothetical protein HBH52_034350 [Parastagonospora nodorum]KAH4060496.1 hypothetical protein HBH49_003010 [Parastagonospora nodorum]